MILPRLATFKAIRLVPLVHVILVNGDEFKAICVRQPIRHGILMEPGTPVTCRSCSSRGWIYTMGNLSTNPTHRIEGKWLTREEQAARA